MLRILKRFGWLAVLVLGAQAGWAFSIAGPINEAYQTPVIGYGLADDFLAPKNLGEEYRRNTPVNYYAFDSSFLEYFGSNGVNAVEQAIGIINALTNTPMSSVDLNQFPLEVYRTNPRAEALNLIDLKTFTLETLVEEMPLAEPDRYVWTLRDRYPQAPLACPFMFYHVIMRNFDPFTYEPSPYINGVLYTYVIVEFCTGPNPLAFTLNLPVDPLAPQFTTVASKSAYYGSYLMGLSRDDVGGLRYMWRTNNVNWESPSSDSTWFRTNTTQAQLLYTSNLTLLAWNSLTNNAAQMAALYPGLQILGTTNTFTNVFVTTLIPYFTNSIYDPVGTPPHLVYQTNRTLTIQTVYHHTFGNLITFSNTPSGEVIPVPLSTFPLATNRTVVYLETIATTNTPWMPFGTFYTNSTIRPFYTNAVVGQYVILPTNSCSVQILGVQAYITNFTTNLLVSVTNSVQSTNQGGLGGTNGTTIDQSFTQNLVVRSIDPVYVVFPVECLQTNNGTLLEGMDTIRFVRTSYDSLIGRYFQPITNNYTLVEITNSVAHTNFYQRVITAPDFLFRSADINEFVLRRSEPSWRTNGITGLAGPGTVDPTTWVIFNRVGPLIINMYDPNFVPASGLAEQGAFPGTNFVWASFSGSPDEFVLYPNGASIEALENEILFSIVSNNLPDGYVGLPYATTNGVFFAVTLQAAGGQAPYSWAPTWDSAPLPPGLTLLSDGTISGTPTEAGTFSFTVMVTEAGARSSTRTLNLTINP